MVKSLNQYLGLFILSSQYFIYSSRVAILWWISGFIFLHLISAQ